jgi:hypothetical protein
MDMDRRSRVQLSVRLLARFDGGCTYCYAYLRYGTVHGSYGLFFLQFSWSGVACIARIPGCYCMGGAQVVIPTGEELLVCK